MGGDFAYALLGGLLPFAALPVITVVCLLSWRISWLCRAASFVALALLMMTSAILSLQIDFPWHLAPLSWLLPAILWLGITRWLRLFFRADSR